MLSPLMMYRPNTSCWTPSCKTDLMPTYKVSCRGISEFLDDKNQNNMEHTCGLIIKRIMIFVIVHQNAVYYMKQQKDNDIVHL